MVAAGGKGKSKRVKDQSTAHSNYQHLQLKLGEKQSQMVEKETQEIVGQKRPARTGTPLVLVHFKMEKQAGQGCSKTLYYKSRRGIIGIMVLCFLRCNKKEYCCCIGCFSSLQQ